MRYMYKTEEVFLSKNRAKLINQSSGMITKFQMYVYIECIFWLFCIIYQILHGQQNVGQSVGWLVGCGLRN